MDIAKEQFMDEIEKNLFGKLEPEEIRLVKGSITVILRDFEINTKERVVISNPDDDEMLISKYKRNIQISGKSKSTARIYECAIRLFMSYIDVPLRQAIDDDLFCWLESISETVSRRTMANYRQYIVCFYSWLVSRNYIEDNPMIRVPRIKYHEREELPFTEDEIDEMRYYERDVKYRAILEFLLATGVRIDELCNMKIDDVSKDSTRVRVRQAKGDKERIVYQNALSKKYLNRYLESRTDNEDCLFASRMGGSVSAGMIRYKMNELSERCNVKGIHPHRFRHTFAQQKREEGFDILEIQKLLGHASLDVTERYLHITESSMMAKHNR